MDTILVILIIGLAAAYITRRFYRSWRKGGDCCCNSKPCDNEKASCESPEGKAEK